MTRIRRKSLTIKIKTRSPMLNISGFLEEKRGKIIEYISDDDKIGLFYTGKDLIFCKQIFTGGYYESDRIEMQVFSENKKRLQGLVGIIREEFKGYK